MVVWFYNTVLYCVSKLDCTIKRIYVKVLIMYQSMWAERKTERAENHVEWWVGVAEKWWSGARCAEREVVEREWSMQRAESAAHSPLQPNISDVLKLWLVGLIVSDIV